MKTSYIRKLTIFLLTLAFVTGVTAQQTETIPVHFAGRIQNVNGAVVVIDQISIDTSGASVNSALAIGNIVVIDGELRMDGVVAARAISGYVPPQVSPTQSAPSPTAEPPKNFVSSGQIASINGTSLTINDQQIVVRANDPVLPSLHVGDQVNIVGLQFVDHIEAVTITKLAVPPASVVIEGIVEKIDKTLITVNEQRIQLEPRDPLLSDIQLGDSLRVEGHYQQTKDGLIFQATQVTILASAQSNSSDQGGDENGNNGRGMGKGMGG